MRGAETRHDLVENKKSAILVSDFLEPGIEAFVGRDGPHVPRRGLGNHAGYVVGVLFENITNRVEIVVWDHDRVGLGHTRGVR